MYSFYIKLDETELHVTCNRQKGLRPSRDPKYIQCEVRVGVPQNEYKQAYKYKIVCQFETLNVNCFLDNCFLYIDLIGYDCFFSLLFWHLKKSFYKLFG